MKKDLLLAILGAVLGAFICLLIDRFKPTSAVDYALLALLILVMLVTLALFGPLHLIFSTAGKARVDGSWKSLWTYEKQGQTVSITDDLRITQYGRYVRGNGRSIRVSGPHPFESVNYTITGEVSTYGIIEGRWTNTDEGRRYRGTFQGRMHEGGNKVDLMWLGTAEDGIRFGQWTWTR